MTGFLVMIKANLKLVLRNKFSIFLFLLIPLISTLILKIPSDNTWDDSIFKSSVTVFDSSKSELSKELINLVQKNNSFDITVYKGDIKDIKGAREKAVNLANKTADNGFMYIPSDFSNRVLKGDVGNQVIILDTENDDRIKILENNINMILLRFNTYSKIAGGNEEIFNQLIKKAADNKTIGKVTTVETDEKVLEDKQKSQIENFGYLVAVMSIILMFSGNFISSIFIDEKNNRVLKRIMLTKTNIVNYGMAKVFVAVAAIVVQVFMIIIGIKLFVKIDVGMNLFEIAALILGLGLIFNTLSITLGAVFQNLSNANYLTFFITTITAMMSGLYFPLDITPKWMQNLSLIMPQRWVVKTAEQILSTGTGWGTVFGCIVIAYMALFLSIGFLGLKINNK